MTLMPVVQAFLKFLGGKMGIRLIILLVVGLGALYTIHLLAQDFMSIRKGAASGEIREVEKFAEAKLKITK